MIERALSFARADHHTLFGVLAEPDPGAARATRGVIVIVGGPQVRAGSHRQFVHLARHLADAGYPTLRFDALGMGDSLALNAQGEATPLAHFESLDDDIAAAVDALHAACPDVQSTVLWGLCDGASAALMHVASTQDRRLDGLVLLNPWIRTEASQAATRVRHYYVQRLLQPEFWRKLVRGGVGASALTGLVRNLRTALGGSSNSPASDNTASDNRGLRDAPYPARMAHGWRHFTGPALLMLSENDYTAREFEQYTRSDALWSRLLAERPFTQRLDLPGADHTCSQRPAEVQVQQATVDFLRALPARRS